MSVSQTNNFQYNQFNRPYQNVQPNPPTEYNRFDNLEKVTKEINKLSKNHELYPQFQNGRVINVTENPVEWFQLFDNNEANNDFQQQSLFGIQSKTPLNQAFFSKENQEILQNLLRYEVWKRSGKKYVIGKQSPVELEIISRSIFLQYARNLPYNLKEQIKELNNIVIHQTVPRIISEIEQYQGFLYNISHQPVPIELPKSLSSKGSRLLRSVTTTF